MATTRTFYVDTDVAPGGDGSLGDPYDTLSAALGTGNGIRGTTNHLLEAFVDIVSSDDAIVINCVGVAADTTRATVNGFTTDVTRNITINGDNTTGKYSTSHYRIEVTSGANWHRCLSVLDDNVILNDIQVQISNNGGHAGGGGFYSLNAGVEFRRCIVKGGTIAGATSEIFGFIHDSTTGLLENCLAYDITGGEAANNMGFRFSCPANNCTAYNCETGFDGDGASCIGQNLLAQSCTDGFLQVSASSDYCCSDIASDAPGTNTVTGTVSFVSVGTGDFTPASGDTVAKDAGLDLSGTFTDDLAGATRPTGAGTWDIGALEYVSAGSGLSASITLTERDGTRRQDLTNIKWAWFDETDPQNFNAPTDTGIAEVTDVEGLIDITLSGTSLLAGQYGCLVLSTSDNIDLGLYKLRVK